MFITDQFQSTSPCLQRGRFAVIPEEPHGSTASGSQSNEQSRINNRSPSPDWDFDTDVSNEFSNIKMMSCGLCTRIARDASPNTNAKYNTNIICE